MDLDHDAAPIRLHNQRNEPYQENRLACLNVSCPTDRGHLDGLCTYRKRGLGRTMRGGMNFLSQINVICPIRAFPAKTNPFAPPPNQPYNLRGSGLPKRARIAIVTDVGSGCGGRGSEPLR